MTTLEIVNEYIAGVRSGARSFKNSSNNTLRECGKALIAAMDDLESALAQPEHEAEPADSHYATPGDAINALALLCHAANARWWHDPATGERLPQRNVGELLMLATSELAEAMEGHRKGLKDDKLPQYDMFHVELVDCLIRIFDMAGSPETGTPSFGDIFTAKMEFNSVRKDHQPEARLAEGGKKY